MGAGAFIGGFLVGIVVTGAFGFLALSIFQSDESGRILQAKYEEFNSQAFINDDVTSAWTQIPDTEMNITTEGDSFLSVTFSAVMILHLDNSFAGACRFNISLEIEGVESKQTRVSYYYATPGPGVVVELSERVEIHLETGTLSKGSYNIVVNWISTFDASGNNQLISATSIFNFTRSLSAWEIST
ncbi:MAG: hypothetical protein ACFFB3_19910 [Candidatus Hodarchaeota archaeon]